MKCTIYYLDYCSHCKAARQLLRQKGTPTEEIDVDRFGGKYAVIHALRDNGRLPKNTSKITFPIVYIDAKYIGGFTELSKFLNK